MGHLKRNIYIREFTTDDAESLLELNLANRKIFEAITPVSKEDSFYTLDAHLKLIEDWEQAKKQGSR
ncbi:MAG TPA: hypothetical protein VI423_04265, partial [Paenisporosarcina sp.]|nr:hypothetical protein [Paenisporosarcina sp.]